MTFALNTKVPSLSCSTCHNFPQLQRKKCHEPEERKNALLNYFYQFFVYWMVVKFYLVCCFELTKTVFWNRIHFFLLKFNLNVNIIYYTFYKYENSWNVVIQFSLLSWSYCYRNVPISNVRKYDRWPETFCTSFTTFIALSIIA